MNRPSRLTITRRNSDSQPVSEEAIKAPEPELKNTPAQASRSTQPPVPTKPSTPSHTHSDMPSFEALMKRNQELKERRTRFTVQHEQSEKAVLECQKIANQMGISSLEELQARIIEAREKDAAAISQFKEDLDQELELQRRVQTQLNQIDSE